MNWIYNSILLGVLVGKLLSINKIENVINISYCLEVMLVRALYTFLWRINFQIINCLSPTLCPNTFSVFKVWNSSVRKTYAIFVMNRGLLKGEGVIIFKQDFTITFDVLPQIFPQLLKAFRFSWTHNQLIRPQIHYKNLSVGTHFEILFSPD